MMGANVHRSIGLEIRRESGPDGLVLIVSGELDLVSAGSLEAELRQAESDGFGRVVVDLGGVEFMDSTGIHALAVAQKRSEANQHALSLRNPSTQVQRVLGVAGIADHFKFES